MNNRRIRGLSAVLAITLSLSMVLNVNAASIDEAQKKAEELESQKAATQQEQNSLSSQLNNIITSMTKTQTEMDAKKAEITTAQDELIAAKVDENEQYSSMKMRIKYMYESGDTQFLEMLLQAKDMTEFLNAAEYVSQISSYDRNMLIEFQDTVKQVADQEAALEAEYTKLTVMQTQLVDQQSQVQALLDTNNVKLTDIQSQIGENAAVLAKLQEEAAAAEAAAQAAAAAAEAAAQQAAAGGNDSYTSAGSGNVVVSGNGQFTNPCPGASYISSEFGEYRSPSDPAHKGRDYAAGTGTPIYAADGGSVIMAGWAGTAGNWVVIDHGNGLVTKYMHQTAVCVSAGQTVSKGQQVGYVGSTGDSSGPHLHFQAESGGTAVDPRNYL